VSSFALRRSLALGFAAVVLALAPQARAAELDVADQEAPRLYAQASARAEPAPADAGPFRRFRLRPPEGGAQAGWSTVYRGGEARAQRVLGGDRASTLPARGSRIGERARPRR